MNIGNMPEEELDDLFRKSASEFHPEFDPAAWQAMEKKLDANQPKPGFWHRASWLTALLLVIGMGFWISMLWLQHKETEEVLPVVTQPGATHTEAAAPQTDQDRKPQAPVQTQTPGVAQRPAGTAASAVPAPPRYQPQPTSPSVAER